MGSCVLVKNCFLLPSANPVCQLVKKKAEISGFPAPLLPTAYFYPSLLSGSSAYSCLQLLFISFRHRPALATGAAVSRLLVRDIPACGRPLGQQCGSVAWSHDGNMACCPFAEASLGGRVPLKALHCLSPHPVVPKVTVPREEPAIKSWVQIWQLEGFYSYYSAPLALSERVQKGA